MSALSIRSGDTPTWELTLTRDGELVNLGGADIYFTAKRRVADTDVNAVFQKIVGDGITVTGTGTADITLDAADTASLDGLFHWDIQVSESDGTVTTVLAGRLLVKADVTLS